MRGSKTILILGGGVMQMPAIRIAKGMGFRVIVADGNERAEGRESADYFEHIDLKKEEDIACMAREYKKRIRLDGVFTAGTDFSTTVAYVAERLGLPGIGYETACNATDKSRMREIFEKKGVRSPRFVCLSVTDDPLRILDRIGFPLVVKPVDNMGARGVVRVDSKESLTESFKRAAEHSKNGRVIAEEYLDGPELSIDALVWKCTITICGVADRHIFFPPHFVEMGHTMPSILHGKTIEEANALFEKGIRALGIDIGAAKGDIKITESGPVIGEIAARLSGGYMSGWTFPYSSGFEVTEAALKIAVGEDPGDLLPRKNEISCERAFISIPGKIRNIMGFENALSMPNIKTGFIRVSPGASVVFPRNNVEKCGNIISACRDRDASILSCERAVAGILLRLEPDNILTEGYLFTNGEIRSKDTAFAYELKDERNIAALEDMEAYAMESGKNAHRAVSIIPLPYIDTEKWRDWHGKGIMEAFTELLSIAGVNIRNSSSCTGLALGKVFWKPFIQGGIQAGLYVIDTVRLLARSGDELALRLNKWAQ